jgi:hypothetical protein
MCPAESADAISIGRIDEDAGTVTLNADTRSVTVRVM